MNEPLEQESMWDPAKDDPPFRAPPRRSRLASTTLEVCGVIAMASPLALWVAWTQTMLLSILALALVCIAVCWLIVHFGR